jgi:predicted nucleic acid-binding protein
MLSYFDSSILLSILLNEQRQDEAYLLWKNSEIKVSSILLRIETIVTLRRIYEQNKLRLNENWLGRKTKELEEYLNEINYLVIDDGIERTIYSRKELSNCKTLDAIHVSTALQYREISEENINLYTFDIPMSTLAKHFKFITNKL